MAPGAARVVFAEQTVSDCMEGAIVKRILLVTVLSFFLSFSTAVLPATVADAAPSNEAGARAGYGAPDPWRWCYNHKPRIDGYTYFGWRSPGVWTVGSGNTAYCGFWYRTTRWTIPITITIDWNSVCREQFGSGSSYIFAPGWQWKTACRR